MIKRCLQLYDGIIILISSIIYMISYLVHIDQIIDRTILFLIFNTIIGVAYPIFFKYFTNSNPNFLKNILKLIFISIITQVLGFITYNVVYKDFQHGFEGTIFFLGFMTYCLLILIGSFLVGYFINRFAIK